MAGELCSLFWGSESHQEHGWEKTLDVRATQGRTNVTQSPSGYRPGATSSVFSGVIMAFPRLCKMHGALSWEDSPSPVQAPSPKSWTSLTSRPGSENQLLVTLHVPAWSPEECAALKQGCLRSENLWAPSTRHLTWRVVSQLCGTPSGPEVCSVPEALRRLDRGLGSRVLACPDTQAPFSLCHHQECHAAPWAHLRRPRAVEGPDHSLRPRGGSAMAHGAETEP